MREVLRRRLLYLLLPGCVMALGATQCQIGNQNDSPDFVTTVAVQDANGQSADTFSAGQQIQFVVSIRNRSDVSQTLTFPTAQVYDFYVVKAGTTDIVWHWSAAHTFAQTTTNLTFSAGQTRTYTVTWSQLGDDSQAVAAGDYEVQGRIVADADTASEGDFQPSDYRSALSLFTVQP